MKNENNAINPEHYNRLDPQPKDVIRSWGLNFNLGNAVKYVARAGHKDDVVQDLKKAQEYIQFEIDAIEAERREKAEEDNNISFCRLLELSSTEFMDKYLKTNKVGKLKILTESRKFHITKLKGSTDSWGRQTITLELACKGVVRTVILTDEEG